MRERMTEGIIFRKVWSIWSGCNGWVKIMKRSKYQIPNNKCHHRKGAKAQSAAKKFGTWKKCEPLVVRN
jgi:hypothetical protein